MIPCGMDYQLMKKQWAKRRARIRQMVKAGIPPGEIAKRFNVSPARISHILKNGS